MNLKVKRENFVFKNALNVETSTAQWDFLQDNTTILGFVGGFGAGKSYVFLRKTLINMLTLKNKENKSNGMVLLPTYTLLMDLFFHPFCELLGTLGIKYKANIATHKITTTYGVVRGYQLTTPEKIVGHSLTYAGIDEFDVASYKSCDLAFKKIIGRLRGCENAQLYITSTPEGFGYLHKIFVEDAQEGRKYYTAKTTDNSYLPPTYIKFLKENYDAKLLQAYCDGKFVNLTTGSCYHSFEVAKHIKEVNFDPNLAAVIMCDFNYGKKPMCWNIGQEFGDEIHIKKALRKFNTNTFDMCEYLESELRTLYNGKLPGRMVLYGDYSGIKKTSNSTTNDWEIIEKHFGNLRISVRRNTKATRSVKNGISAVNNMLEKEKIIIDPKAKVLIEDLEQTVWSPDGMKEDQSKDIRSHSSSALRYYIDYEHPLKARIKRY